MAKYYEIGQPTREIKPRNGKKFRLEEAQKLVGGWVEMVHLYNGKILLVNEEGRIKNLPYNEPVSLYAGMRIVGNAILCEYHQF